MTGTLVVKTYRTTLFARLADHTYVECGTGAKGWSCWGGKTGGTALRSGTGSTRRADAIAGPDERGGITCYLVNGVCHQAANRILMPAGITVRGARGYPVSEALFGPYGRYGVWPCHAPFHQHAGVTGDLPQCVAATARGDPTRSPPLDAEGERERQYLERIRGLYERFETRTRLIDQEHVLRARPSDVAHFQAAHEQFALNLFGEMCRMYLGPSLEAGTMDALIRTRQETEHERVALERGLRARDLTLEAFGREFDAIAIRFQEKVAKLLHKDHYIALFGLQPGDAIALADPTIIDQSRRGDGR